MSKNLKIQILVGLPASGKSTYAKNFVLNNSSYIRVNRDDFRSMFKNQTFCHFKVEEMISKVQEEVIRTALNNKFNVIVDNTNTKMEYINNIINTFKYKADIEFKLFDTDVQDCILRDSLRINPVGKEVILKFEKQLSVLKSKYKFPYLTKETKLYTRPSLNGLPSCYIFDIDGTLAHYQNYRSPFEWSKVGLDEPDYCMQEIYDIIRESKVKTFIVSGRDASCRKETEDWLDKCGFKHDGLFMRPVGDHRKDTLIKEEIYNNNFKGKFDVLGVFDDRLSVCKKWIELGLKVFIVGDPDHNDF